VRKRHAPLTPKKGKKRDQGRKGDPSCGVSRGVEVATLYLAGRIPPSEEGLEGDCPVSLARKEEGRETVEEKQKKERKEKERTIIRVRGGG